MNLTDLNIWAAQWAPCMFRACWQGALAVVGVWAICRLFPRLPASLRTILWWLVCLKTLLGLVMTGPLSLPVLPAVIPSVFAPAHPRVSVASARKPTRPTVSGTAVTYVGKVTSSPLPEIVVSHSVVADTVSQVKSKSLPERFSLVTVVLCLWLTGVIFLLIALCRELRIARRLAGQAGPCPESTTIQEVARAIGLAQSPPVLVSERADCSLVVGPWRPAVVLCRADLDHLSPRELRALLAHELAHVRRQDLWAGVLPNLVRLLFFFDPLVWLACREYDLAREAACDAEALRVSGLAPADYGRLLLKLSITSAFPAPAYARIATLGAASPQGILLRRRLRGLQKRSATLPRWCSALALVATVGALSLNPVRVGAGIGSRSLPARPAPSAIPSRRPSQPTIPAYPRAEKPAREVGVHTLTTIVGGVAPVVALRPQTLSPLASPLVTSEMSVLSVTSHTDSNNQKEDQTMSNLPNNRTPKLSTAFAAVALTAGAPILFTPTPAAAQETPAPVAASPAPAPAAPVPSVAPAAPEVAPAPIAPPDSVNVGGDAKEMRYQYTMRRGNSFMTHTTDKATADGQRTLAKAQPGDCLIVDRDGKRYLITDAATLNRIQENYAPMEALGKQMEAKGKEMEETSKPMEALGKQMEAKGKDMEAIGKQMEQQGKLLEESFKEGKSDADRKSIQEQMKKLQEQMKVPQEEMRGLGEKMREQGAKMRPLGDQQREFGRQMRGLAREAEQKMTGIIDDAFKNNLATEQKA